MDELRILIFEKQRAAGMNRCSLSENFFVLYRNKYIMLTKSPYHDNRHPKSLKLEMAYSTMKKPHRGICYCWPKRLIIYVVNYKPFRIPCKPFPWSYADHQGKGLQIFNHNWIAYRTWYNGHIQHLHHKITQRRHRMLPYAYRVLSGWGT